MADLTTPTDLPMHAQVPRGPLLSTLTRWWQPADAGASDAVLGYESAQPWMLGDTRGDAAALLHD
ncbi:hypothetical protein ACG04Q_02055 [Roseateles sp. DXS20W]|uniref:Uncharacterized protein n=1 Tax=Pelomonas lactea TaxID=3299030 RepID=A0ABW7GEI0_9BURK